LAKGFKTGGKDFKPGQSGNPKGSKPLDYNLNLIKLLTAKELGLACTLLVRGEEAACDQAILDPQAPMLHKIIAKALLRAFRDGDFFLLDKILDRVVGKAPIVPSDAPEDEQQKGLAVLAAIRKVIHDPGNERTG
jgi:hypothetical protein